MSPCYYHVRYTGVKGEHYTALKIMELPFELFEWHEMQELQLSGKNGKFESLPHFDILHQAFSYCRW